MLVDGIWLSLVPGAVLVPRPVVEYRAMTCGIPDAGGIPAASTFSEHASMATASVTTRLNPLAALELRRITTRRFCDKRRQRAAARVPRAYRKRYHGSIRWP